MKQGALGVFLKAVESGQVESGSVLIVEALDRLSRAAPIVAQAQLAQIVNHGITVITASDGREYNFEKLKADPMNLVYSLLVMIRSHEESDSKSKRTKAAIRKRCEQWVAGTYRGIVAGSGTDPAWVEPATTGTGYVLRPERALAVRTMIDLYRQGYGAVRIMEELDRRGLSLAGGLNGVDRVAQLLNKRTLIGEKVIEVDGTEYRLPDYYPRLLSDPEFAELQHMLAQRTRQKGKGEIPALFTGLRLSVCGYCGSSLVSQNGMDRKRREDGLPHDGHRRIVCTAFKNGLRCAVGGSCSVVPIERALLAFCSDKMNLSRLVAGDSGATARTALLTHARSTAATTEDQITKLMDAMMADPGAVPAAFSRKVVELEERLTIEQKEVERLERELVADASTTPAGAQEWSALVEGVLALDYNARMKARQLVADSFRKIAVYRNGFMPGAEDSTIGLLLVGKRGSTRMLSIERGTGGWTASSDIDVSGKLPVPESAR